VIVAAEDSEEVARLLAETGETVYEIGRIIDAAGKEGP
jgi:phosphoribosylaminoimidazole (AIR) synthetase